MIRLPDRPGRRLESTLSLATHGGYAFPRRDRFPRWPAVPGAVLIRAGSAVHSCRWVDTRRDWPGAGRRACSRPHRPRLAARADRRCSRRPAGCVRASPAAPAARLPAVADDRGVSNHVHIVSPAPGRPASAAGDTSAALASRWVNYSQPDYLSLSNLGHHCRRLLQIALGIDLRHVRGGVAKRNLRRFQAEPFADFRPRGMP